MHARSRARGWAWPRRLSPDLARRGEALTPEHLTVYYRQFQDENSARHAQFNRGWWADNVRMLWPAWRAHVTVWRARLATWRAQRPPRA